MALANRLTLIDDSASLLDDVAALTKTAGAKTAGVLGDDLALNAQQVTGVRVDRELPVVWAVFKGSLLNKTILVPLALAISAFVPWLVTPLLTLGGLFLPKSCCTPHCIASTPSTPPIRPRPNRRPLPASRRR